MSITTKSDTNDPVENQSPDTEKGNYNTLENHDTDNYSAENSPTRIGYIDHGNDGTPLGVMVYITADELRNLGVDPESTTEVGIHPHSEGVFLTTYPDT